MAKYALYDIDIDYKLVGEIDTLQTGASEKDVQSAISNMKEEAEGLYDCFDLERTIDENGWSLNWLGEETYDGEVEW